MSENIPLEITDAQFEEEVLKREGISVVDFWAPWCGPCHTMAPALEAFARLNTGKVSVFKLDVDESPKAAVKYNVRSVPTVVFFKDGKPVETSTGALSEAALQEKLDKLL